MRLPMLFCCLFLLLAVPGRAALVGAADWVSDRPVAGGFPLSTAAGVAPVRHDGGDHAVVGIAVADLTTDLATVTGRQPASGPGPEIWVGTLGQSQLIDGLANTGKLDLRGLRGAWESYLITIVRNPAPGVPQALVIAGSDRRGTAYGIYELSRAVGVSPWLWWADVPPPKRPDLYVADGLYRFGPPTVKYRGIFINDEDWGLQPWAANSFDPQRGDIGPKTYEKVFGLLLRLRANLLWPAMHEVTQPFNTDPENARLADRYAIVMGSSHAEPMLRNNVGEWKEPADHFNYATYPDLVRDYWRDRLKTNGGFENIYTLGMRGIHDSGIVGPTSLAEKQALLSRILADQRALLSAHVSPDVEHIPQVFTPYKEVLEIYRAGLALPDDVTLVWPDDNFGYIRQLPNAAERARSGGSGVYYHLSYLGAPLSHLWLSTVPPALIGLEMGRAYDAGARTLWVANVGDIKPAETNIELFLSMGWDMQGFRDQGGVDAFLAAWAAREFGADLAPELADILTRHHQLNFQRKPEHLQWWLPGQKYRRSDLDIDQAALRLAAFEALESQLDALLPQIPPARRDAFFQLVEYPVRAAALANRRFFDNEAYERLFNSDPLEARRRGALARAADARLKELTRRYNEEVAGGKWRGLMAEEPADGQWRGYRLSPPVLPAASMALPATAPPPPHPRALVKRAADDIVVEAEGQGKPAPGWRFIPGLGRGLGAVTPTAMGGKPLTYTVDLPPGDWVLSIDLIPTFPNQPDAGLRLGVALDGGPIQPVTVPRQTGDAAWVQGVLDGRIRHDTGLSLSGGTRHRLRLTAPDTDVVVDALVLRRRQKLD